jgi:hypothetical protein
MKFSIRLLAAGLVLVSAASAASAQAYWATTMATLDPGKEAITGLRMTEVPNTAAAVATNTVMARLQLRASGAKSVVPRTLLRALHNKKGAGCKPALYNAYHAFRA